MEIEGCRHDISQGLCVIDGKTQTSLVHQCMMMICIACIVHACCSMFAVAVYLVLDSFSVATPVDLSFRVGKPLDSLPVTAESVVWHSQRRPDVPPLRPVQGQ